MNKKQLLIKLDNKLEDIKKNMAEADDILKSLLKDKLKIAVCIGHSETSQGAINKRSGVTEYMFNNGFTSIIDHTVLIQNEYTIFRRDPALSGSEALNELIMRVNKYDFDIVVCLHANAYNGTATGSEVWCKADETSADYAEELLKSILKELELKNRGVKIAYGNDRASYINRFDAPAVLLEPFFIDNNSDFERARERKQQYFLGIMETLESFNER